MTRIAKEYRHLPDAKVRSLVRWIREHQCPGLPEFGERPSGAPPAWSHRRVLIFTENREGTKRYLKEMLEAAVRHTHRADQRIEVLTGLTGLDNRREIQRRFNADPEEDPLRILIATDAAREGLNLQAHCADLFHFDLPWNPGRIEQRNGRIDRKLQPAPVVTCRYFKLPQRAEDRVLEVLVRKTETIRRELGSLARVIADTERLLRGGIRPGNAGALASDLGQAGPRNPRIVREELEATRDGSTGLQKQLEVCRNTLEKSRRHLRFDEDAFRDALSRSLELQNAGGLIEERSGGGQSVWRFPALTEQQASDPSWRTTLDSLRSPRKKDEKEAEWRKRARPRPVVFRDPERVAADVVHLHLEQRLAQRLLARFRSQGFLYHDLSRACLTQGADSIPRVVLLGRLSLYGAGAERLHQEVVRVAARWFPEHASTKKLRPFGETSDEHLRTMEVLDSALTQHRVPDERVHGPLLAQAPHDVAALRPALKSRADQRRKAAETKLRSRGDAEAKALRTTLERQRKRVAEEWNNYQKEGPQRLLFDELNREERRQAERDAKSWKRRLQHFETEIEEEPKRVRDFYEVRATRLEPVGVVYLWPDTN